MQKLNLGIKYALYFIGIITTNFFTTNFLQAQQWTSSADGLLQFAKTTITKLPNANSIPASAIKIKVDAGKTFQTMEGFGYGLTGGSAQLIDALPKTQRTALLKEIFGQSEADLGVSYIRISIGASDLDAEVFSYSDLPKGKTDSALTHFSLSQDTLHLIPILKEVLAINPSLKIMASPWSPPVWMKTNGISMGGHLLKKYYAASQLIATSALLLSDNGLYENAFIIMYPIQKSP